VVAMVRDGSNIGNDLGRRSVQTCAVWGFGKWAWLPVTAHTLPFRACPEASSVADCG